MSIEALKNALPEYAKDLKLNLSSLAQETLLTEQQRAGTFIAVALASRERSTTNAIFSEFASKLSPEALNAARAAASIMAMNNIYYRFNHLASAPDYKTLPARLRMNVIGKPGVDKVDFELWCLAVSAINGCGADERRAARQERSKPLLEDMHAWLLRERETLSRSSEVLKPMNYMLRRWDDFARFLDNGRICLTNNCAERALRGIALGRRNWTFAGSQRGADRAAIMLTMITTCRLNDVDPKAWFADVLARIADLPASRLHELLPWEWKLLRQADKPADQQAA